MTKNTEEEPKLSEEEMEKIRTDLISVREIVYNGNKILRYNPKLGKLTTINDGIITHWRKGTDKCYIAYKMEQIN
jgi:hypothetical protein